MTYTLDPLPSGSSTPKDYHRIHFDPSQLPDRRIVGLLACQRDPLLKELQTRVISASPAKISDPPAAKGRAKQKPKKGEASAAPESDLAAANGSAADKGTLWEVELEDTVIFPEGGGQPFDTGTLTLDDGFMLVVEGCLRRKLDSVHLVRVPKGHETILEGVAGREALVKVDWIRRMDHMIIHTAQHLLSALLDVHAEGLPTLSWGFAPHSSLDAPYVELPRALTWAEAEEVERKCNEAIQRDVKIWVDVTVQEEGYVKETAQGVRENRGIPQDYTDGVIRHIIIDGIDKNACCGTQLPNLGLIQYLHVIPPSTPSTSSKPTKSPTRLFFTAGPRAFRYLNESSRQLSLAAQTIAVGRNDLVERVEKMDNLRKEGASREKDLRSELAGMIAANINTEMKSDGIAYLKRSDKATHDFEFLSSIVASINGAKLVVLVSAPPGSVQNLILLTSPDADVAKSVHEKIKNGLNGAVQEGSGPRYKGGGAKGRFMGKVDGKWGKAEDEIMDAVAKEAHTMLENRPAGQ